MYRNPASLHRLHVHQLPVIATQRQKLIMSPALDYPSFMHHTYQSALRIVDKRVGYHKWVVRSRINLSRACRTSCSLSESRADVASSRISIGGFFNIARALSICAGAVRPKACTRDHRYSSHSHPLSLHYEIIGIRYPGSLYHLLHRGVLHTESDIIVEGVIE